MFRQMCKSKIHRATVKESNVDYEGSITIDRKLMDAADLLPFEKVQIANINTGARLDTYVIEGEPGSGMIGMNGAAAHLVKIGDPIHIICYAAMSDEEAKTLKPTIVHVNESNDVVEIVKADRGKIQI